ncbi:hypothetical protein K8R14_03905 [bacterium]|nr:hypothetical protein [bacterium]
MKESRKARKLRKERLENLLAQLTALEKPALSFYWSEDLNEIHTILSHILLLLPSRVTQVIHPAGKITRGCRWEEQDIKDYIETL